MAKVYAAQRVGPGPSSDPIVIKKMHPHLAQSERFIAMFVAEARLCSRLDHPNIVKLHDFEATDHGLSLVLELVDGCDLRSVLKACNQRSIRMPPRLAAFVVAHVLEALDYAHDHVGIVHRDLSPGNILVSRRGRVKLADFGIARAAGKSKDLTKNMLVGKFGYMSPEHVVGKELDGRSDIFSAGIVLAELLMCRRLFIGRSNGEVLRLVKQANLIRLEQLGWHIPIELRSILSIALARRPADRFPTAAAFRDALTGWLDASGSRTGAHELGEFVSEVG